MKYFRSASVLQIYKYKTSILQNMLSPPVPSIPTGVFHESAGFEIACIAWALRVQLGHFGANSRTDCYVSSKTDTKEVYLNPEVSTQHTLPVGSAVQCSAVQCSVSHAPPAHHRTASAQPEPCLRVPVCRCVCVLTQFTEAMRNELTLSRSGAHTSLRPQPPRAQPSVTAPYG